MLMDSVGQEFGQNTIGQLVSVYKVFLGHQLKRFKVEGDPAVGDQYHRYHLKTSAHLAIHARDLLGPQMGLSAPTRGLSMWPGLPVGMMAGFQSKCPKRQKRELSAS